MASEFTGLSFGTLDEFGSFVANLARGGGRRGWCVSDGVLPQGSGDGTAAVGRATRGLGLAPCCALCPWSTAPAGNPGERGFGEHDSAQTRGLTGGHLFGRCTVPAQNGFGPLHRLAARRIALCSVSPGETFHRLPPQTPLLGHGLMPQQQRVAGTARTQQMTTNMITAIGTLGRLVVVPSHLHSTTDKQLEVWWGNGGSHSAKDGITLQHISRFVAYCFRKSKRL